MKKHRMLKIIIILGIISVVWAACGDSDKDEEEQVPVMEEMEEDTQKEAEPEKPEEPVVEEQSDTEVIDPDFKAMMDSYEVFFNEYVEFMKTYNESDDTVGMLADYTEYMTKYTDCMTKMNALEDENLNPAETAYYLEVNSRIMKKLAEVVE